MSPTADPVTRPAHVLPFLKEVLERDGAAVEAVGPEALFVVLSGDLAEALELPSAATLDLSATPSADAHALPLEGTAVQRCIERARARGRRAGARLGSPPQNPKGRLAKARGRLVLPNTTLVGGEALRPRATRLLLEFGYDAQCEERTEGRIHVAVPEGGCRGSLALARALTPALGTATPEAPAVAEDAIQEAVGRVAPTVETEVARRLEGFCRDSRQRMEVERERIVAYHDHLVQETRKRRRRTTSDASTLTAKKDAILRQRAERLDALAERHAVASTWWLASALVLRYEVGLCRFRLRRRRREVVIDVEWDPFLGDFLGHPCAACGTRGLHVHVCDAEGHVTCGTCAARCETCGRVTCRACHPAGCGCTPSVPAQSGPAQSGPAQSGPAQSGPAA